MAEPQTRLAEELRQGDELTLLGAWSIVQSIAVEGAHVWVNVVDEDGYPWRRQFALGETIELRPPKTRAELLAAHEAGTVRPATDEEFKGL